MSKRNRNNPETPTPPAEPEQVEENISTSPDAAETGDSVVVTLTSKIDVYIDSKGEVDSTFTLLLSDIPADSVGTVGDLLAMRGLKVLLDTASPATDKGKPTETRKEAVKRRLAALQDGTYNAGRGGRRPVSEHDKALHKIIMSKIDGAKVQHEGKRATKAQIETWIESDGAYGALRLHVIEPLMEAGGYDDDRKAVVWDKLVAGIESNIADQIALAKRASAAPSLDDMLADFAPVAPDASAE